MHSDQGELINTCAWCLRRIAHDEEHFGFGAKANPSIDLSEKEGQFIRLELALQDKTLPALVPSRTSQARKDSYDLIFITCSAECAQKLKDALELERDVFKDYSPSEG